MGMGITSAEDLKVEVLVVGVGEGRNEGLVYLAGK